jgi:hypothetical protein
MIELIPNMMPQPRAQPSGGAQTSRQGTPSFLDSALEIPIGAFGQEGAADAVASHLPDDIPSEISSAGVATAGSSAGAIAEATSVLLELHTGDANGVREVVSLPWRLAAVGRLSQELGGGFAMLPVVGVRREALFMEANPAVVAMASDGAGTVASAHRASELGVGNSTVPIASRSRIEAQSGIDSSASSLPVVASSAAAQWLARWTKWIEREGRDPTLWLRDFRINGSEADRIVENFRAFAREHGLTLDRIVINGREFWRNPQSLNFQE